jgi:hypothetical protein
MLPADVAASTALARRSAESRSKRDLDRAKPLHASAGEERDGGREDRRSLVNPRA